MLATLTSLPPPVARRGIPAATSTHNSCLCWGAWVWGGAVGWGFLFQLVASLGPGSCILGRSLAFLVAVLQHFSIGSCLRVRRHCRNSTKEMQRNCWRTRFRWTWRRKQKRSDYYGKGRMTLYPFQGNFTLLGTRIFSLRAAVKGRTLGLWTMTRLSQSRDWAYNY